MPDGHEAGSNGDGTATNAHQDFDIVENRSEHAGDGADHCIRKGGQRLIVVHRCTDNDFISFLDLPLQVATARSPAVRSRLSVSQ